MSKNKDRQTPETGTTEWLQAYLYDRWQRVRRRPDYIEFCEDHTSEFDDDGILETFASLSQDAEEIREKFGLEMIYLSSKEIPKNLILEWPVFKKPLAVNFIWHPEKAGISTPIWNDHYIRLEIDVLPETTEGQILDEVREFVNDAREVMKRQKLIDVQNLKKKGKLEEALKTEEELKKWEVKDRAHLDKREDCYKVWDERKAKKPFSIIAQEMGLNKETTKKRFYRAYELIMLEPYDREAFLKRIIGEELVRTIKTPNGRYNKKAWEKLLQHGETRQKHLLTKQEPRADVYGINNTLEGDPQVMILVQDIAKMCKTCSDNDCAKLFFAGDFKSWDACQNIRNFLKN